MIKSIKKHKELVLYSLLNIMDKGLIFLIPIVILFLFKDQELYNKMEYIYAISSMLMIFLDFGIKNYIFYNFKNSRDKANLLKENRVFVNFLLYFYSIIIFFLIIVNELCFSNFDLYLYVFIFVRSLYSILIAFYSYYYRLIDKPSKIYIYSLTVSLATIGLGVILYFINQTIHLYDLFLFQILLIILTMFVFRKLLYAFNFKKFFTYIKDALSYSYPILINQILSIIINQFGKVYAYNFMSANDMTSLSLLQRSAMLIALVHASIFGYFSKKIFIEASMKIHIKIFLLYSFLLVLTSLSIISIGYINNMYKLIAHTVDIKLLSLLIMATLLWCFTAYSELYFNKTNKNKFIPYITLIGFLSFSVILMFNVITVETIITAILLGNGLSLIYSIFLLQRKRILVYEN